MATTITTTTVPEPDNTKGLYKIGQSFVVGKDTTVSAKGIVGIPDNVCVDGDLYLKDKTVGGFSHIILNAATVKNLDDTVKENKQRLDTLTDAAGTDVDTIVEIVAAFEAGDSQIQGNVTTLTQGLSTLTGQQATNATNITNLTTQQGIHTANITDLSTQQGTNTTNITNLTTQQATNATNITNLTTQQGTHTENLTTHSDLHAEHTTNITNLTTQQGTNASGVATNLASITTINATLDEASTNNTDIANIKKIVPALDGQYLNMVPQSLPQTLGTLPNTTTVNILLHLGPIWRLVCINNNANHITYLHLNEQNQQSDGSILDHYELTTAVEMSALYTPP